MNDSLLLLIILFYGMCIGSFLNVCIYRLPHGNSIVKPGSACPACQTPIKYYDNIPLLSFLWLRGKCRTCNHSISIRYPLIELATGMVAIAAALKFGLTLTGLIYFVFLATLIVVTFIDIDHRIIPDIISLPGIVLFFLASFALPAMTLWDSLGGILLGGGSLSLVAFIYRAITKKDGMGGGDIKLLAMIGALIGYQGVLFTIFAASVSGTIVGFVVMGVQKGNLKIAVPFGPFLSLGAVIYLFFGTPLIGWYLGLAG